MSDNRLKNKDSKGSHINIEKELLQSMVNERLSIKEIADRLNCSSRTVSRYISKFGIKRERLVKKDELKNMLNLGFSNNKIAKKLGCSETTIRRLRKEYGLKDYRPYIDKETLLSFLDKKMSFKKIARTIGVDVHIIYDYIKFYGIEIDYLSYSRESFKNYLVELKGGKCVRCGYNKYIGALEFHHISPEDKHPDYRSMSNLPRKVALEEIKKCILVCSNCHKELHACK